MAYKAILVGCGGHGGSWCRHFLPPNVKEGLVQAVAAVDMNPAAFANAREGLNLPEAKCYTDMARAFGENKADFAIIVVPPAFHEKVAEEALKHGLHILSEKPIADTLEASVRIANKAKKAGVKMGVTMSHRFDQDKTTLREHLRSGRCGALDYLVCRFTCDARKFGVWGKFRHEIKDTLLIEGSVHHLDILADLAGAKCDTIYAQTWTPKWGEYAGDCQALVTLHFENGARATHEGAKTNAIGLNGWTQEYIRAECEGATFVLDRRELRRFSYDPSASWRSHREGEGEPLPLRNQPKWANTWLVEKFVKWLDGGEPMETNVEDNLQSVALVCAGIESSRTGQPVKVQEFLAKCRREQAA